MATISYLEYSDRDMKYARDMFSLANYDPCGRFCQQAVEKRMKHYIEHNGTVDDLSLLHTHALVKLYSRICEIKKIPVNKKTRGDLYQLTSYYFDTNYPAEDGNVELTEAMATEAITIMLDVCNWVDADA